MRLACIGIGSNAIRLLVAGWENGALVVERRERRGTRLFAGLVNGALTQESIGSSVEAIAELADIARADGAQEIFVFATSAVRDATNSGEFTKRAQRACGVPVEIVSGDAEAALSYVGAHEAGACGVIDIGGGSTEFTLGDGEKLLCSVSLQMGAVRMNAQHSVRDLAGYRETVSQCERLICRDARAFVDYEPRHVWIGVGGTMTTLGAMKRRIPLFDEATCEGMEITAQEVISYGEALAQMSMDERRAVPGLMPHRADIIPSGIAILDAAMRCFSIPAIRLSAHGNMDGYLRLRFEKHPLAAARV